MTAKELMAELGVQLRAEPARTEGLSDVYEFDISGDGGGHWWIEASDGTGTLHEGVPPTASVTVRMTDDVFVRLGTAELDGAEAFAEGLVTVEGDQGKVMHLPQLFGQ